MNTDGLQKIVSRLIWLLICLFAVLKLFHVVHFSWWWVFSPLWIPGGIIVLLMLIFAGDKSPDHF